jgi:hypothetical protein
VSARDYSLPQDCPSELHPHLPAECGDIEHMILSMTDDEYDALMRTEAYGAHRS